MTAPNVTELPLQLEPTTPDSFIDDLPDRAAPARVIRELDRRQSDRIDIRLLWSQADDRILVAVDDGKTGEAFAIPVEPHEARLAFCHPYSYAASQRPHHHELAA
jgi:hypothetical protein